MSTDPSPWSPEQDLTIFKKMYLHSVTELQGGNF